jgi:DNA-binding response OmpR family regulator
VARIKAVLRRGKNLEMKPKVITIDTMELDLNRKSLTIDSENILLTRKEFEILNMLISSKGKYLSRQEILDRIWSDDVIVTERNVDVNIARLRKKIGEYGSCIKGRSGYGYCFEN